MKIRYLGTGAAEGVPAMFCSCEYCTAIRAMGASEWRKRTQILIDGVLSVDFPPEAYGNCLNYGVNLSNLAAVLVTHSHMDHFYAHDFILRGYKYGKLTRKTLEIFGNGEVYKVYKECTAREMREQVEENIKINTVSPYSVFKVLDYKIAVLPARHCATEQALLYYIERDGAGYLHLFDTNTPEENVYKFLKSVGAKVDTVSYDCTFGGDNAGDNARHMGIVQVLSVKRKLAEYGLTNDSCKHVITHFSHNCNPTRANMEKLAKTYNLLAAYDGMEIEI